jgi:hypothetical protein
VIGRNALLRLALFTIVLRENPGIEILKPAFDLKRHDLVRPFLLQNAGQFRFQPHQVKRPRRSGGVSVDEDTR